MSWLKTLRPSPAIVVAVMALVAAVAGTAIAGPGSFKLTTSDVKQIAKREAKKVAPRSAQAFANEDALLGPATDGTVVKTRIKAPRRGFLLINAGADVFGGTQDSDTCNIEVDGTEIPSSNRTYRIDGNQNTEDDCVTETTVKVGKGRHRVAFIGTNPAAGNRYDEASIQVEWVKFGNGGASNKAAKATIGN